MTVKTSSPATRLVFSFASDQSAEVRESGCRANAIQHSTSRESTAKTAPADEEGRCFFRIWLSLLADGLSGISCASRECGEEILIGTDQPPAVDELQQNIDIG